MVKLKSYLTGAASSTVGKTIITGGAVLAALLYALLLSAYTPFQKQVGGMPTPSRWPDGNTTWSINPKVGPNVDTVSGVSPAAAISGAFQAWQQTLWNGQRLNSLNITQAGDTDLTDGNMNDCINIVSFQPSADIPTGTIALTTISTVSETLGAHYTCQSNGATTTRQTSVPSQIVDADIVFNPRDVFSTSTPALPGHFDLQSVASHEIGHFLGLNHSGIAHTLMYPLSESGISQQRELGADDVLGIAFLYPSPQFASSTGTISGRVTLHQSGVFAAHLVVVDETSGTAVLDGLTNPDGTYKLVGVPPGKYRVLVQPLAGAYSILDFAGWTCGFGENSPPCCDPAVDATCTGHALPNATNYTGTFF